MAALVAEAFTLRWVLLQELARARLARLAAQRADADTEERQRMKFILDHVTAAAAAGDAAAAAAAAAPPSTPWQLIGCVLDLHVRVAAAAAAHPGAAQHADWQRVFGRGGEEDMLPRLLKMALDVHDQQQEEEAVAQEGKGHSAGGKQQQQQQQEEDEEGHRAAGKQPGQQLPADNKAALVQEAGALRWQLAHADAVASLAGLPGWAGGAPVATQQLVSRLLALQRRADVFAAAHPAAAAQDADWQAAFSLGRQSAMREALLNAAMLLLREHQADKGQGAAGSRPQQHPQQQPEQQRPAGEEQPQQPRQPQQQPAAGAQQQEGGAEPDDAAALALVAEARELMGQLLAVAQRMHAALGPEEEPQLDAAALHAVGADTPRGAHALKQHMTRSLITALIGMCTTHGCPPAPERAHARSTAQLAKQAAALRKRADALAAAHPGATGGQAWRSAFGRDSAAVLPMLLTMSGTLVTLERNEHEKEQLEQHARKQLLVAQSQAAEQVAQARQALAQGKLQAALQQFTSAAEAQGADVVEALAGRAQVGKALRLRLHVLGVNRRLARLLLQGAHPAAPARPAAPTGVLQAQAPCESRAGLLCGARTARRRQQQQQQRPAAAREPAAPALPGSAGAGQAQGSSRGACVCVCVCVCVR
jgi:hypothetical protein